MVDRDGKRCGGQVLDEMPVLICMPCRTVANLVMVERANRKASEATRERRRIRHELQEKRDLGELSVVYYVRMPGDLIKIGTTSDLHGRLRSLTLHVKDVLACEPGSFDLERERHKQFAHLQWRGSERFRATDELLTHVAAVRSKHGKPIVKRGIENVVYQQSDYDYSP